MEYSSLYGVAIPERALCRFHNHPILFGTLIPRFLNSSLAISAKSCRKFIFTASFQHSAQNYILISTAQFRNLIHREFIERIKLFNRLCYRDIFHTNMPNIFIMIRVNTMKARLISSNKHPHLIRYCMFLCVIHFIKHGQKKSTYSEKHPKDFYSSNTFQCHQFPLS